MPFFSELFELTRDATVALIVSGDHASGQMTISVVPKPRDQHKEDGLCRDLTLVGTPGEFDEQFLHAIREYRCARSALAEQAKTTVRVLEAATQVSAAKANSKGRTKPEATRQGHAAPTGRDDSGEADVTVQVEAGNAVELAPQADLFE